MNSGTGMAQFSVSRENFTHLPDFPLIFSSYHILTISDYASLLLLILPLTRQRLGVRTTTQTWRSRELFSSLSLTESIFFLCFLPAPISLAGALEWVAKLSLLKLEELWLLPLNPGGQSCSNPVLINYTPKGKDIFSVAFVPKNIFRSS